MGVVRPITQTEKQAMRSAFEQTYGAIEETVEPSDDYISSKTEEVESGEVVASALSEVTSKRSARTMGIQTTVDTTGHVMAHQAEEQRGDAPEYGTAARNFEDRGTHVVLLELAVQE